MCGVVGFIDFNKQSSLTELTKMVNSLNHRGPDDSGQEFVDAKNCSIGLGHARLSIIDLSASGHQPMHFQNLSIVYNGEIYNFQEIKDELIKAGHKFVSHSDTEVVLHAYAEWGRQAVNKFIGMFVIVLLDKDKNVLEIWRDRAGVKPLYYYWHNNVFLFSSELKTFHKHASFKPIINTTALHNYFHFGYIPSPHTIFNNCFKLNSGSQLSLNLNSQKLDINSYWKIEKYYTLPKFNISYDEAKASLKELLLSACNYRMVADVPIGVFLSGGYDSTAVTALLQSSSARPLNTYTIGFYDGNNEAPDAFKTAKFLGTNHHEHYCTTKEAQDIIPDLPYFYDEPFADSSAIPTMLVSKFARQDVTVALSADGGDELFGGYEFYKLIREKNQVFNLVPNRFKFAVSKLLNSQKLLPFLSDELRFKISSAGESINLNSFLQTKNLHYRIIGMPLSFEGKILKKGGILNDDLQFSEAGYHDELEFITSIDYQRYLQDDILVKVDRATMAFSLEGREPLLDHRIAEFAAQLPVNFKWSSQQSKIILKDIVHEFVPPNMLNRPKMGFSLPINKWLRDDLSFLIDEHLSDESIAASGLFNEKFVSEKVKLFKENKLHHLPFIWKMLMFQMWFKKWML